MTLSNFDFLVRKELKKTKSNLIELKYIIYEQPEKKIINKEDWRIKLYQLDKFEMLTPVDYEIVNENDSIILGRHRLTGAENLQDVDKFYAKIQDSIFYVCYPYPEVVAIKHISNLNGSNQWELIKKLQKHDAFLYLFDGYVVDKYLDSLNQKVQPSPDCSDMK